MERGGLRVPCIAALLFLASHVSALYSGKDAVIELNANNFDKLVSQSDGVAIFYAPWCGHCKELAPHYKKVASNLQGLALVGAVDCADRATNDRLCARMGIRGFPTIKVFGSDKTKNPYTGELSKEPIDYNGPRSAKAMVDAVSSLLTDVHITRLRSKAELGEFARGAAGKPQVLLFTSKTESTLLYKSLSTQLRSRLAFGEVHQASGAELVAEFGVEAFPSLLVVKPDGTRAPYTGELKAPALLAHLSALAGVGQEAEEEAAGKGGKAGKGSKKAAAAAFVRQVYDLSELPALEAREDMALLALHGADGPDGCKEVREAFLEAAADMQPIVNTLLVSLPASDLADGSEGATSLERIGADVATLRTDPCELQVVLLPLGKDKPDLDDYQKYNGPPDGKALQRWVADNIPGYFVTRMDDTTTGAFIQLDPSRGRMSIAPKVILFTSKDEAPATYKALAMAFRNRGNMMFGWVQVGSSGAKKTVETFKPDKVPSMTVIIQTQAEEGDPEVPPGGIRMGQQPYSGPLKYGPMREFLEQLAKGVEAASGGISTQTDFEKKCTSKAGLCLLALLDTDDEEQLEVERQALTKMAIAAAREASAFHFVWADGLKHKGLMQAFGVLSSDLPTLVALSAKRMRFAVMPTPEGGGSGATLKAEAVARFVEGVLGGKVRTSPLQALPDLSAPAGAGSAGTAASRPDDAGASPAADAATDATPVEEEFDLSEIMSEEVEGGVAGAKADRLKEVEEQIKAEEEARKAAESGAKKGKKKKGKGKKKIRKEEL
ncbi:hypothetical protein GPECTOR_6g792 [Gonium pectorale]|uniref:protein disulfide-isomerase n=1 Tax=Gonium pectorale TaxID=33097 RepID=A0A150GVQ0_GONPE|nr:hypothetical protein GPECTOR_6g792 [Gonium pectorale]|eukprot:KXZ53874.1 hypothetical protein GPECTOR_6g792 [Gonium pectorale]